MNLREAKGGRESATSLTRQLVNWSTLSIFFPALC